MKESQMKERKEEAIELLEVEYPDNEFDLKAILQHDANTPMIHLFIDGEITEYSYDPEVSWETQTNEPEKVFLREREITQEIIQEARKVLGKS